MYSFSKNDHLVANAYKMLKTAQREHDYKFVMFIIYKQFIKKAFYI